MNDIRQPVVIMERGSRVDVEASVFPVYRVPGETFPSTGAALGHGTTAECEEWIIERSNRVVLVGRTIEVSDWLDQKLRLRDAVGSHELPDRCIWRPPEEIEQALAEATSREEQLRATAVGSLARLGAGVNRQRPPTRGEKALAYYNVKRARIGAKPLVICDEYTEDDAIADAKLYGWDG